MIKNFEDFDVYQRAQRLYPIIVNLAKGFPPYCDHLRNQVCRSANSIQANIAEGYAKSENEFKRYLLISLGSCNETLSHLKDAMQLNLMDQKIGEKLLSEYTIVGKQLYRLRERWTSNKDDRNMDQ